MNIDLAKIIKLVETLNKEQLLELNKVIVNVLKTRQTQELTEASTKFKIGDIASFVNDGKKFIGIVFKINLTTIQVITLESMKVKVSPTYLTHESKPSKKALKLKDELFPIREVLEQMFNKLIK